MPGWRIALNVGGGLLLFVLLVIGVTFVACNGGC
jgi:hypothetical protein